MNYCLWLKKEVLLTNDPDFDEGKLKLLAAPVPDPGTERITVKRLVVHHSATNTGNAACFRVLHRAVRGWADIGYHYVIGNGTCSPDGMVETGRKVPFRGAHARGANGDSLGICLVGNYEKDFPSTRQLNSLGKLLQDLLGKYGLKRSCVTLHRLVKGSSTVCPGGNLTMETVNELLGAK